MDTINPKPIKKVQYKLKKMDTIIPFIVSVKLEKKIRYLCNKFNDVEWSGVLFTKVKGSFEENNLKLIGEDFFLMDIGSATYTEFFSHNDEMFEYQLNNNLLDHVVGLCHSHNNMQSWFSGTDEDTLAEEGNERNHFISLIVNNKGQYVARITRKVNKVVKYTYSISYRTFNDEIVESKSDKPTSSIIEELQYFNCNVITEEIEKEFPELDKAINRIKEEKERKKSTKPKNTPISTSEVVFPGPNVISPKDKKTNEKIFNTDNVKDFLVCLAQNLLVEKYGYKELNAKSIKELSDMLIPIFSQYGINNEIQFSLENAIEEAAIVSFDYNYIEDILETLFSTKDLDRTIYEVIEDYILYSNNIHFKEEALNDYYYHNYGTEYKY